MRGIAALVLAGALPATLGGLVFWAIHGSTTVTRSIAYGFWFAAAVMLTVAGAGIDAAGT